MKCLCLTDQIKPKAKADKNLAENGFINNSSEIRTAKLENRFLSRISVAKKKYTGPTLPGLGTRKKKIINEIAL